MTAPNRPEHEDRDYPITGADPRLTVRRHLSGYSFPNNGNVHNPTPRYTWLLLADGRVVDSDYRKAPLVAAARENGTAYINETCG